MLIEIRYRRWWDRTHFLYRFTHRSVLLIEDTYWNIEGFKGKLTLVNRSRLNIEETRHYRYDAIAKRKTLCNHIDLNRKYKFDMMHENCPPCYLYTNCRLKKRRKLALKDVALVNKFLVDNRDIAYAEQTEEAHFYK